MTDFWTAAPPGRVTRLAGISATEFADVLAAPPDGAPAVVRWQPPVALSTSQTVAAALAELEETACRLFPAWLRGAEGIDSPEGLRPAAVRALARRRGGGGSHFGPFLMDLAERAIGARGDSKLRAEVRAAGLARVIADSFGRTHTALLVAPPEPPAVDAQRTVWSACEWLAHHGGFALWLTGGTSPPAGEAAPVNGTPVAAGAGPVTAPQSPDAGCYPPLAGQPHHGSEAEQALEAALVTRPWAAGRVWNQPWHPDRLTNPVRVDLLWQRERCAVEIDGPEHGGARKYEADRQRDVLLQLAGFAVLRFTNGQIRDDLDGVLWQLERFLTNRRIGKDNDGSQ